MTRWTTRLALTASALLISVAAHAESALGEVVKLDRTQQKITLKHEEIKSLDMPAMTMSYRMKDPAALDTLKVGDRVRFDAEKINGQYTVMRIAPAN